MNINVKKKKKTVALLTLLKDPNVIVLQTFENDILMRKDTYSVLKVMSFSALW